MKRLLSVIMAVVMILNLTTVSLAEITEAEKEKILQKKEELDQTQKFSDNDLDYVYATVSDKITATESDPIEKQFCADFTVALEKRWNINEGGPSRMNSELKTKTYKKLNQVELDILQKYEDADFGDPFLGLLAKAYIKALNNQNKAIEEFGLNDKQFDQYWKTAGSNLRALVIYLIGNYYNVKTNRVFKEALFDMRTRGRNLTKKNDPVDYLINFINE